MRVVVGVVSLLIGLMVAGWAARAALRAGGTGRPVVSAGAASPPPVPLPQQVQRDVDAALRQGAVRNDAAESRDDAAEGTVSPNGAASAAAP